MSSTRHAKPFTVEMTARSVTFTFFAPVPGAEYLQPSEVFRIPKRNWTALVADGGPKPDSVTYCNFTPAHLAAHGVQPEKL